ncbi:MAG: TonB-dependent receptor, partial [Pseudomonadota bacterium]
FVSAGTAGPFSTTAAGFAAIKDTLQPETSRTYEFGWRFRFDTLRGSLAAYHVDFDNRLLTVALGPGILGAPSGLQNVGGVKSEGIEAAGQWAFAENWSVFASYSYNHSTYQDDVRDGDGNLVAATSGKDTVDTPRNLFRAELSYDNGALYGSLGLSYTDKRFFTYLNDQSVPSYTLGELTLGYRFSGDTWLNGTEVQFNATNLADEQYVSTIGSNGFGNAGDAQTLLAGAPRQVFVTLRHHF